MDIPLDSNNTHLNDRILWFDGDSSFYPDELCSFILSGKPISENTFVTEITEDVIQFNNLTKCTIGIKSEVRSLDTSWNIPEHYSKMLLNPYIYTKLAEEVERSDLTREEAEIRIARVKEELGLFRTYDMMNLLRCLIYIVDQFIEKDVVWGTGRGSSCCSYILYLIGLHDVDSVRYGLDLKEFFR